MECFLLHLLVCECFLETAVICEDQFHAGIACIQILMHRGTELRATREHIQTLARPIPLFYCLFFAQYTALKQRNLESTFQLPKKLTAGHILRA